MYLRKMFLFSLSASALWGASLLANHLTGNPELDASFLSRVYGATENIRNISLDPSLDPRVSTSSAPFAYSLFSTNLTSFSSHLRDSFDSWYLFRWAESLLNGTSSDSFNAAKAKIFNHLLSLKRNHSPSTEVTPKNWLKENHIITSSKDTLKSTFDEIFFKKLYLADGENGTKVFAMDQTQKEAFGDPEYVEKIIEFQKKLFDFWTKNEQPRIYCRRSWGHSSSFSPQKLYGDDPDLNLPSAPDFRFPDFHGSSEEIVSFIKAEKSCQDQDHSPHTLSDLSKLADGHELSGFLHVHRSNWTSASKFMRNKSDFPNINNPLEIFIADSAEGDEHSQWKLNGDILAVNSPLSGKKDKILLNLVDIKGDQDKYSTFLRTNSGLVMIQKKSGQDSEEAIKGTLLSWNPDRLKDILRDYFHSHSLEFLGELLKDGETPGIFPGAKWSESLRNLLSSLSEYLLLAEKNQRHGKLLEILSSATTRFLDTKFSDSKPSKSTGLATPLQLSRNLNKDEAIEEMNFSNFSSQTTNDGDFQILSEILGERRTPLEISRKLRESIHAHINSSNVLKTEGNKNSHFFNDYLLDNVLHGFLKNEAQLKNHTLSLLLINELKFKVDDPDFLKNFIDSLGLPKNLTTPILEEMVEGFLANRYLKEKIENRLNYGGFKHDKNCIREIVASPQSNVTCSSRPQLNIKLKNYWFMKNHYFNQHAYELGSGPMFEYLKFLYTFSNLIKNDFYEFRRRASSRIPSGGFGALVWANGVLHEEDSAGTTKVGESETISNVTSLKNENGYFRNPQSSEIFNPFFSRKIKLENHVGPSNISRESLSAFAGSRELYGFRGFHAQKIKDDDLSHVWEAIFDHFPKSNPKDNRNYGDSPSGTMSLGSAYGYSHGSETLGQILDSFKRMSTLENFLKTHFPSEYQKINKFRIDNLEELRSKAGEHLLREDFSAEFRRATTRFSGHLQNPNSLHSILSDQKYLIQRNSSSNEGHIVRIIQINKYDLGYGFRDLVKVVGARTLIKTLILMAENDEEMVNGIVNLLL